MFTLVHCSCLGGLYHLVVVVMNGGGSGSGDDLFTVSYTYTQPKLDTVHCVYILPIRKVGGVRQVLSKQKKT